jgi:hypothetical protein
MSHPEIGAGPQSDVAATGADLANLLGQACGALDLQCRAAHQELRQTQRLLTDATRHLLDCFHAASRELSAVSAEAVEPEQTDSPAARVEANLMAASQHLQFSDLVGQLLSNTEQRVDGLLRVSERLTQLLQALTAEDHRDALELAREKRAFLEALAALETCGSNRVRQSDMTAGEAELF